MGDIKQFVTAAKENHHGPDAGRYIEFIHDGRKIKATKPKDGQLAMLLASISGYASEGEQAKGTIDFFINMFESLEDRVYWRDRLLSSQDDFDLDDLEDVLYWLVGEFSARPTKPSSDSTSQQQTTGDGSTATADSAASDSSTSTLVKPAT